MEYTRAPNRRVLWKTLSQSSECCYDRAEDILYQIKPLLMIYINDDENIVMRDDQSHNDDDDDDEDDDSDSVYDDENLVKSDDQTSPSHSAKSHHGTPCNSGQCNISLDNNKTSSKSWRMR